MRKASAALLLLLGLASAALAQPVTNPAPVGAAGAYNSSPPTCTNLAFCWMQVDVNGNLKVSIPSGSAGWVNTNKVIPWDGTTNVTVKPTSTAPANTDTALVIDLPPRSLISVGTKGAPGTDFVTVQGGQGSATARGGTITSGGVSQTLIASNATRAGFIVQNPCSAAEQGIGAAEDLVLNLTSAATLTTNANLVVLAPCASFSMGLSAGLVSTEAVTAIATTTNHIVYAKEF